MTRSGAHYADLATLFGRYGLSVVWIGDAVAIPGSYWGDSEAGLIGNTLYVRDDTPVHSALHEACHWVCMSADRRAHLHTDAGGSDLEECAVNFLQVQLADALPRYGRIQLLRDMDDWGYSFRLGSAQAWFEQDAEDARTWLITRGLITSDNHPTYFALA